MWNHRSISHGHRNAHLPPQFHLPQAYIPELDRIVLRDAVSKRPFASTQTCRCVLAQDLVEAVRRQCHAPSICVPR